MQIEVKLNHFEFMGALFAVTVVGVVLLCLLITYIIDILQTL